MTTKRRKLLAIVLLAVIGGVIAYSLLRQDDEPTYQGRRLSEWLLKDYKARNSGDTAGQKEARVALHNIGTNALPYFLKWIGYERPAWRLSFDGTGWRGLDDREIYLRANSTRNAFALLGTNASSAIPQLHALMKNTKRSDSSIRAIYALGYIGEPAIPVLKDGLTDSNQLFKVQICIALRSMAEFHGTNTCVPVLLELLNHGNPSVRSLATNVMRELGPDVFTNATPK